MCLACDAVDSGRGAHALVRFWHTHANMRWLRRALLPAAHVAPTVSLLHTPIVDSSVSKKRHQRATLLASAVFFYRAAAPQLPCALRGCCPSRQRLTGAPTIILQLSRVNTTAVCLPLPPGTTMRKYIPLSKTGYAAGALGGPRRRAYKHLHYAPHNF